MHTHEQVTEHLRLGREPTLLAIPQTNSLYGNSLYNLAVYLVVLSK